VTNAETDEPLTCAALELTAGDYSIMAVADDAGVYAFHEIPAGTYDVFVFSPGMTSIEDSIEVAGGETAVADWPLTPLDEDASSISGTVTDEDTGYPLAGVAVEAFHGDVLFAESITCADGLYEIAIPVFEDVLKTTTVALLFTAKGYEPETASVAVAP